MSRSDNSLRRRKPKRQLKVTAEGHDARQVPLDGTRRIVTVTYEAGRLEDLAPSLKVLAERLGDDTLVVALPPGAKLEIFDLVEPEPIPDMLRPAAEWNF